MKQTLHIEMDVEFFNLEEIEKAEALAKQSSGRIYTWKTIGRSNWLEHSLSRWYRQENCHSEHFDKLSINSAKRREESKACAYEGIGFRFFVTLRMTSTKLNHLTGNDTN